MVGQAPVLPDGTLRRRAAARVTEGGSWNWRVAACSTRSASASSRCAVSSRASQIRGVPARSANLRYQAAESRNAVGFELSDIVFRSSSATVAVGKSAGIDLDQSPVSFDRCHLDHCRMNSPIANAFELGKAFFCSLGRLLSTSGRNDNGALADFETSWFLAN
jgi:hypothetical protein